MNSSGLFLGNDFFAWMLLAMGGALFLGNTMALIRRPDNLGPDAPARPPKGRVIIMATIGLFVTIWSFASLVR